MIAFWGYAAYYRAMNNHRRAFKGRNTIRSIESTSTSCHGWEQDSFTKPYKCSCGRYGQRVSTQVRHAKWYTGHDGKRYYRISYCNLTKGDV